MLDQSKDRWEDLVSWCLTDTDARYPSMVLRDKLVENEVKLVERTMVTTLLTQEDGSENRVFGAMGFYLDSEEPVVVLAQGDDHVRRGGRVQQARQISHCPATPSCVPRVDRSCDDSQFAPGNHIPAGAVPLDG